MTMPASARMLTVRCAMAGVGIGPQSITRPPIAHTPLAIACSSMYPERRVSLPRTTRGAWLLPRPATNVTARPSCSASSGVIGCSLAIPRMPSVPKSVRVATVATPLERGFFFMGAGPRGTLVAEVHELELDAHIFLSHGGNGCLEVVLVLSRHAHLSVLN